MRQIITLTNGKKVANFSSPYPFVFEDGSVLDAVSKEEAKRLEVTFIKEIDETNGDVELSFNLPVAICKEIEYWFDIYDKKEIDIVYCPLPMITAMKKRFKTGFVKLSPFRVAIRVVDRVHKVISISKQCI